MLCDVDFDAKLAKCDKEIDYDIYNYKMIRDAPNNAKDEAAKFLAIKNRDYAANFLAKSTEYKKLVRAIQQFAKTGEYPSDEYWSESEIVKEFPELINWQKMHVKKYRNDLYNKAYLFNFAKNHAKKV